jgi:GMP synthase PP-ATPase subunit
LVNEYFLEQYNMTPQEYIAERFQVDEVYAFSSTLKCIREPSEKNIRIRNKFYQKIGHAIPTESQCNS